MLKHSEGFVQITKDRMCSAVSTWLIHGKHLINSNYYSDSHSTNEDFEFREVK